MQVVVISGTLSLPRVSAVIILRCCCVFFVVTACLSAMLCILLLPHVCCCYIWVKLICLYVILGHVCSCLVSDCTHSTLLGVPLVIWSLSSTSFIYVRDFIFAVTKYLCFS